MQSMLNDIPKVVFGSSCLGNLYQELPYSVKLAIAREWMGNVKKPMIDTAGKYGATMALEVIGQTLAELNVANNQVFLSNKLGWRRAPLINNEAQFEKGVWINIKYDAIQDINYSGIMRCYEEGLEAIGHGYKFDFLSVHDPDEFLQNGGSHEDVLSSYKALFELKNSGETKAIGIGSKDWKVIRDFYKEIKFDWVMFACGPTILNHPPELLEFMEKLHKDGVTMINSAVFNGGFLTGSDFFDYRKLDREKDFALYEKRQKFWDICNEFKVNIAGACVEFGMMIPGVRATALNTSNPIRIKENVELVNYKAPKAFWTKLKQNGVINL